MKKLFLLILIVLSINAFSQFVLNIDKNIYYKAKIELENGEVKDGYVLSFDDKSAFYYNTAEYQLLFSSPESNGNLNKEHYVYKADKDAKDEKIALKDIKRISVDETHTISGEIETVVYEKVKIVKPTNDLTLDFKENTVLLPVFFSNGKITVYSFTELICNNNSASSCGIKGYNYYFLPKGADYAVKPFEITAATIFSIKKIGPKIHTGLAYMGKDCPLYLEHLESRKSKYGESYGGEAGREYNKANKAKMDEYKADLKKAKKSMSKEDFRQYEIDKKFEQIQEQNKQFYNAMFNEEVMDYINSCE